MKTSVVFPGQGTQAVGMAKEFYENFDVAKQVFEEVNSTLKKDLTNIMFNGPEDLLTNTANAQPAIMTASIAILKVLEKELGYKINNLCSCGAGHSLGEYSALCASGVISLSDTAKLLKTRGEAFASSGEKMPGSMATIIGKTIEEVEEIIDKARIKDEVLGVANDNMAGQTVISGNINSVENAIKIAQEIGVKKVIKLPVSGAFHSKLMEPALENMKEILGDITINESSFDIFANYTAKVEKKDEVKDNLLRQITGRVRWRETIDNMTNIGVNSFIEIGFSTQLNKMIKRMCPEAEVLSINSIDSLKDYINSINNK